MVQAEIANLIEGNIDQLVEVWTRAVRQDKGIQSDSNLSDSGLIDHVPFLLEEICMVLRSGQWPTIDNTHEARVHAYTRFRQGYRARDLVREAALLRLTLFDYVTANLHDDSNRERFCSYLEVLRIINLYIDEELRYAVSIYTEPPKPPQ